MLKNESYLIEKPTICITNIKYLIFGILLIFFITNCNNKNEKTFKSIIHKYKNKKSDSLKLQSINFIRENYDDLTSEKFQFYESNGNPSNFNIDTITSDSSLNSILLRDQLHYESYQVNDFNTINFDLIESNIDSAIMNWNRYPWSKNVPKDIFLNYLLPYKILNENPEDWRRFMFHRFEDSLSLFQTNRITDVKRINKSLVNNLYQTIKYSANYNRLCTAPSLTEIMAIKKGDCFSLSHLFVYMNRSVGIPSTIDIVPYWGVRNGGHATDVFYQIVDNGSLTGKVKYGFAPAKGNELIRPPKVFRISFKKTNMYRDSIKPFLTKEGGFAPKFLISNHLIDVTDEYTSIKTLNYKFDKPINNIKLAFICVYNSGKWRPIFYGKVNSKKNYAQFNKVAKRMLYQIAVPVRSTFKLVGRPFIFNEKGKLQYASPNDDKRVRIVAEKISSEDDAWIKKGKLYTLKVLSANNCWKNIESKFSERDSVIQFASVPGNGFYMIKDVASRRNNERFFLFKNGLQVWY